MIGQSHPRPPGESVVAPESPQSEPPRQRRRGLTAGGTEGNERLTTLTGIVLIVLLAVLGVTIVRIGQLLWLHLFLGLLLLGPVALKLLSTGYRFLRYYTHEASYRRKGPPPPSLRVMAPLVVALTLAVFVSGIALLWLGPSSRHTLGLIHKVSFFAWLAVTAVHVLGHLPEITGVLSRSGQTRRELADTRRRIEERPVPAGEPVAGGQGRWVALGSALLAGLLLAVVLAPSFSSWTH
jgi:hypothetical protein